MLDHDLLIMRVRERDGGVGPRIFRAHPSEDTTSGKTFETIIDVLRTGPPVGLTVSELHPRHGEGHRGRRKDATTSVSHSV